MKKCLRIAFGASGPGALLSELQKKGSKLGVEGTLQFITADKELVIIVCGQKEHVDQFVDLLHEDAAQSGITEINIEPYVKVKDYRNAFRIIE